MDEAMNNPDTQRIPSHQRHAITVFEARKLINAGAALVDVRPTQDYRTEHVRGSLHFPLEQLHALIADLPQGRPLITLCKTGVRSATATTILRGKGLTAYTLRHGLAAWDDDAQLTTEPTTP